MNPLAPSSARKASTLRCARSMTHLGRLCLLLLRPYATAAIRRSPILPNRRNIRYAPVGSLTRADEPPRREDDQTSLTALIAPTLSDSKRYARLAAIRT